MAFDNNDPYQVHAYFLIGFWCNKCRAHLTAVSSAEVLSDQWCTDLADQARAGGWFVPPASDDGTMDIEACFCPGCAVDVFRSDRPPFDRPEANVMGLSTRAQIYIAIMGEGVDMWRPVDADDLGNGTYRIVSINPDPNTERWRFETGDIVRVGRRRFADGTIGVVAVERVGCNREHSNEADAPDSL
jgi:hypothetical protein